MMYGFEKVAVVSYTDYRDAYGQPHREEEGRRDVDMAIKIAYQINV
jgi:hypothetical protein